MHLYLNCLHRLLHFGASKRQFYVGLCLLVAIAGPLMATGSKRDFDLKKGKICIGTNGRMSVPSNKEHHYRNLRDRYTNCTYVDGNLELTWLAPDPRFDLSFLQHIREVTGYVLISHVSVEHVILPNLQIIRGQSQFKLNMHEEEFSLLVTLSSMKSLQLPMLRDILTGSVGVISNYNLCHLRTINWTELISDPKARYTYLYNFSHPEPNCTACHESCNGTCWGEGKENCQKFSKVNCSPQCHAGRCFGPQPRECCHLFCAGGCTGPKQSDCLACKKFYDDGVCKEECPQMQRYNPMTYSWENNPDGKYAYGATCVKNCPEHLLKDNGACVRTCPPTKKALNGECVPCDGPCPKTCMGVDKVNSGNIDSFKDCTVIEGSLKILQQSFTGYQDFINNYEFGPHYLPMSPDKLEVFSTLKEITGFLDIQASHENFTDLRYFRNLEVIGGRQHVEYFSALYIVKTSLRSLELRSLKTVRSGNIAILENPELCFAEGVNWTKVIKTKEQKIFLQNNRPVEECAKDELVCHKECSREGCWGPTNKDCLSCERYALGRTCVESCSAPGIYYGTDKLCDYCHEECSGSCNGPGPGNCTQCKNVKDGPYCIAMCPSTKYIENGECLPCHKKCVGGCTGSGNFVGEMGCFSCEKALFDDNSLGPCLKADEPCPDGYFSEYVGAQEMGILQPLAGKSICRKCHLRCKNCTGYGFHLSVCNECAKYRSGEQCEDRCAPDYYADDTRMVCEKCSDECRNCYGPGTLQCESCRNYRVYIDGNFTMFNCTATCPPEKPFKILPEDSGDPYCSSEDPMITSPIIAGEKIGAIVGGVVSCIFLVGVFVAVFGYQWWQRAKSKENTIKMTMRMSGFEDGEPLKPSNVKPNLAQLRIVKEAELRKGGVLGYGAFGVVYKGVWVPENENIKIPVAIKVLREGTGTNKDKEILEEAYIMASVEHPNLLKLLAVCMTSQIMLVTQLMPLGCLLDYVRNNKDKIGSKPLLNWCTQIAKGMAHLEEKRLVHRDLAARNVLVQTPGCVKITDFGLAKLLDANEDEYKAAGGKMPIKWLALECIQHRRFTHKSDVWAFGVTVWELLTYGGRPYDNVPAREVPDLLEKGERLPQPAICTIDVYMIMLKCWMLDAESRPKFKELSEEFAKMARDPGRYLVIAGDKLMRLPTYSPQDEKELLRTLSVTTDGPETVMDAEEYLQPKPNYHSSNTTGSITPPAHTPTMKFSGLPASQTIGRDGLVAHSPHFHLDRPDRKYAHLEAALANSPNLRSREDSMNSRYSSDPLKLLGKEVENDLDVLMNGTLDSNRRNIDKAGNLKLELPVDEEDYLMPSPHANQPSSVYMDLIGDNRAPDSVDGRNKDNLWRAPDCLPVNNNMLGLDNPEYHIVSNSQRQVPVNGVFRRKNVSSEEDSDHEYYNEFDSRQRELQPLNHKRNETTV